MVVTFYHVIRGNVEISSHMCPQSCGQFQWGYSPWQRSSTMRVWCRSVVSSACSGAPMQGRPPVMRAAVWVACGLAPGDRQRPHACVCMRAGGTWAQSPRQAADSRRSEGSPETTTPARVHLLDGLRKDGRARQPRHLRHLRQRSPHSAVQCSHQAHLRWLMHRCPAPAEGCRSPVRYRSLHYTRLAEARGENYGRVPWVVDSSAMSCTEER